MSRRGNRGELITIYWRDIPAQVTASRGADRHKALLDDRFQVAIDRAATVAGLTETEAYIGEWRRIVVPFEGDPADAARAEGDRLESAYPDERLEALVFSGGVDPDAPLATGDDPTTGSET